MTGERGSVAAEFAVTLPAAVLVVVLGVAALAGGAQAVAVQDAAADAARLVARGEPLDRARATGGAAAESIVFAVDEGDELVCVDASAPVRLGSWASALTVSARACALAGGW